MKVWISYSDGTYSMTEAEASYTKPCVEVTEIEWKLYQEFIKLDRVWHSYLRDLDNKQYEFDYPGEGHIGEARRSI